MPHASRSKRCAWCMPDCTRGSNGGFTGRKNESVRRGHKSTVWSRHRRLLLGSTLHAHVTRKSQLCDSFLSLAFGRHRRDRKGHNAARPVIEFVRRAKGCAGRGTWSTALSSNSFLRRDASRLHASSLRGTNCGLAYGRSAGPKVRRKLAARFKNRALRMSAVGVLQVENTSRFLQRRNYRFS